MPAVTQGDEEIVRQMFRVSRYGSVCVAVAVLGTGLIGSASMAQDARTPIPVSGEGAVNPVKPEPVAGRPFDPKRTLGEVDVPIPELAPSSPKLGDWSGRPRPVDRRPYELDVDPRPAWAAGLLRADGGLVEPSAGSGNGRANGQVRIGDRVVDRSAARADLLSDSVRAGFKLPGAGSGNVRRPDSPKERDVTDLQVDAASAKRAQTPTSDDELSVELPELRTESSKTYVNPDGTRTAVLYVSPVHVRGSDGKWTPVDPAARVTATGFSTEVGSMKSTMGPSGVSGPLVSVSLLDGTSMSYRLEGAKDVKPEARGSRVFWRNVYPQADFQVEQFIGELKAALVLNQKNAASSYTAVVSLPVGAVLRRTDKGGAEVVSAAGKVVGVIAAPSAFDANGRMGQMTMEIGAATVAGQTPTVSVKFSVRADFLTSAVFPVSLDPTVAIGGQNFNGGNGALVRDAMVNTAEGAMPAGRYVFRNGWWQYAIEVGRDLANNQISRGLWKWDIPAGIQNNPVTSAKFVPYLMNGSTQGQGRFRVQPITSTWNEANVDWNSQPQVDPTLVMSGSVGYEGWGTSQVDVTPWIRRWQTNPATYSNGIMVRVVDAQDQEMITATAEIEAAETAGYGAQLVIDYIDTQTLPAASTRVSPVSAANPSAKPVRVETMTPTLSASAVAGAEYFFRVALSPSMDGQIYDSGWSASTTHTMPSGVLEPGKVYWW